MNLIGYSLDPIVYKEEFWTEDELPDVEYKFDEQTTEGNTCPMLQSVIISRSIQTDDDKQWKTITLDTSRETITVTDRNRSKEYPVPKDSNLCYYVLEHFDERFGEIY